jgi:hypothetical protein
VTDPATKQFVSGFMNTTRVPAPQANLFATILSGIFDKAPVTWLLYAVGLALAALLEMMSIPPLAFAIGMYLPLEINTPLFVGGLISHFLGKSSKDKTVSEARVQRGTLVASGFIAGGALMGVAGALLTLVKSQWEGNLEQMPALLRYTDFGEVLTRLGLNADKYFSNLGQVVSLLLFVGLCLFLYFYARRGKAVA